MTNFRFWMLYSTRNNLQMLFWLLGCFISPTQILSFLTFLLAGLFAPVPFIGTCVYMVGVVCLFQCCVLPVFLLEN